MTEPKKADWGNRIILLIFGALAVITIGAAIFATTTEWDAGNFRSDQEAAERAAEAEALAAQQQASEPQP